MTDIIPIVNEKDEIISYKDRSEIKPEDIYRITALWIENSKGEILLAQRSFNKKNNPGKFGQAVIGTVEKDETYEGNILKELFEELGLRDLKLIKKMKVRITEHIGYNFFCQWFSIVVDKPVEEFKTQKEELECVKWFSKEDLSIELKNSPDKFVGDLKGILKLFYGE